MKEASNLARLSRVLRHGKHKEKEAITIVVNGERIELQIPCASCKGGQFGSYNPHTSTKVGKCHECKDGLVDSPLYAAIRRFQGDYDELPGTWRAKPVHDFGAVILGSGLPKVIGIEGTEHFYPDYWHPQKQYDRALCCQGDRRDRVLNGTSLDDNPKRCKNCERIKAQREHAVPSIFELK